MLGQQDGLDASSRALPALHLWFHIALHHCLICNCYQIQPIHLLLLMYFIFPICVSWLLHNKEKDTDLNTARHKHSWTHFYTPFPSTIKRNKCTSRRNMLFFSQPFLSLRLLQAACSQGQGCLYRGAVLSVKFNLPWLWTAGLYLWWLQKLRLKKERERQTPVMMRIQKSIY